MFIFFMVSLFFVKYKIGYDIEWYWFVLVGLAGVEIDLRGEWVTLENRAHRKNKTKTDNTFKHLRP